MKTQTFSVENFELLETKLVSLNNERNNLIAIRKNETDPEKVRELLTQIHSLAKQWKATNKKAREIQHVLSSAHGKTPNQVAQEFNTLAQNLGCEARLVLTYKTQKHQRYTGYGSKDGYEMVVDVTSDEFDRLTKPFPSLYNFKPSKNA